MQLLREAPTEILHLIKSREKVNREDGSALEKKIVSLRDKGKFAIFEGRFELEPRQFLYVMQVINKIFNFLNIAAELC
jgi:hypothetical protein